MRVRQQRDARPQHQAAQVRGCGMAGDAHHAAQPDQNGGGARLAMLRALEDAALRPEQVSRLMGALLTGSEA